MRKEHDSVLRTKALISAAGVKARQMSHEQCVLNMVAVWERYAVEHKRLYGSKIGDYGYAGREWADMGSIIIALLNCETGSLDCGTIDGHIRATAKAHGYEEEL